MKGNRDFAVAGQTVVQAFAEPVNVGLIVLPIEATLPFVGQLAGAEGDVVDGMDDLFTQIGERIRLAREDRGWTQAQLGEAIGYTQATIGNYELGRRHVGLDDLYKIADALGKPYSYFVGADKQAEEQAKREVEQKVRSDVAGFVGVRMLPVLQNPLSNSTPLGPDDIVATIPVPREFGARADLAFQVTHPCPGSGLRQGDYVFVRRAESGRLGQIVLGLVSGCTALLTCDPQEGYVWTVTGDPVSLRPVTVIGEFCGLFTEGSFAVSRIPEQEPLVGWDDLSQEGRQQVQQFVDFLRARRSLE